MGSRRHRAGVVLGLAFTVLLGSLTHVRSSCGQVAWGDYGMNPQHTALSGTASQALGRVVWQTPVDLHPQYSGTTLYIHYGSPLVSAANTLVIPVKTGASDSFRVEVRNGSDGSLRWQLDSDYTLPAYSWTPSYGPTLTPNGRLYMPGAGGTLLFADNIDGPGAPALTRSAFYGIGAYNTDPAAFNADIRICTPLTSDSAGDVYFGYRATGANPLGIQSGIARIDAGGAAVYVPVPIASDGAATQVEMNCAPALSHDGRTLYVALSGGGWSSGVLAALDATDLHAITKVALRDPRGGDAGLADNSSASPMVAPDGNVYFGVLEAQFPSNGARGWMLQFDADLVPAGAPGAFGWDDTPSVVPAGMVPSYHGASSYLLMTKYNSYAGFGGVGINKLAILDPGATQLDAQSGVTVMKEILTIAGVTPDPEYIDTYPDAVREWCINSAVVDSATGSVLANSEDGRLYRWDLRSNAFTQAITLTPGIGEAYTPTLIGRDGKVYAINNATLFAVGAATSAVVANEYAGSALALTEARPNPFRHATTMRFSLPAAGRVDLGILDPAGRRVVDLVGAELAAGDHTVNWDGRDAGGRRGAPGLYFARLTAGGHTVVRKLVVAR